MSSRKPSLACYHASVLPKLHELGVNLHLQKCQEHNYSILMTTKKQLSTFLLVRYLDLYVRAKNQLLNKTPMTKHFLFQGQIQGFWKGGLTRSSDL